MLPKADVIAVDCETGGLHPDDGARIGSVGIAWRDKGGELQTLGLPFDQGLRDKFPTTQLDIFGEDDPNLSRGEWDQLMFWLQDRHLVMHNGKFDVTMLEAGTREWEGPDLLERLAWDVMVAEHELEPLESLALDAVAQRAGFEGKSGADLLKGWLKFHRLPSDRYDLVPWSIVEPYLRQDAKITYLAYEHQLARFESGEADWSRLEREMQLLGVLFKMERRGVAYDAVQSHRAANTLEKRADDLEAGMPFMCDITSAKAYFFNELKMTPDRLTDKGAPSLDAEQVERWAQDGVQWAKEYAAVTKARRTISMHYRGYPEKLGTDGRLRTNFKQCKVKSGRMSVDRVQLQAMPTKRKTLEGVPGVRDLLRAKSGHSLWSLDLSQAELRVASQYAKCQRMLELLRAGADAHGDTARRVLGSDPDQLTWKGDRDVAKRLNFSAIFLVGAETFQATLSKETGVRKPLAECETLIQEWRAQYPEFGAIYRRLDREAGVRGHVRLLPDTRYETRSWFGPHDETQKAWSRQVQGSLAEALKLWLIEIEREWPGVLVLTVHDSVLLELPNRRGEEIAGEVAALGADLMTNLFDIEMGVDADKWWPAGVAVRPAAKVAA